MPPSPSGLGENSTMSSVDLLGSQSGHVGGHGTSVHASSLTLDGGGEPGFCDGSAIGEGTSRKVDAAQRVEFSPLKVGLILGSHEISNS